MGWGKGRLSLLCLSFSTLSAVVDASSKLPLTVSAGMDHGLPHGLWQQQGHLPLLHQQHVPWTSVWSLMAAQSHDISTAMGSMDPNMALDSNTHHRHQHSFRQRHRPWMSTWSLVVAWARGINPTSRRSRTTDSNTVLGDSTYHEYQSLLTVRTCIRKW